MAGNLPAQQGSALRKALYDPRTIEQLKNALPKHISAEHQIRVFLTAMLKTPQLLDCSQESILLALLTCSQLGLRPDGKQAAILPFKSTAQFIPMYQGLMSLARRSDKILSFHAAAVYQLDTFTYELGLHPTLKHVPHLGPDPGPLIAAYAVAQVKGQTEPVFRVVPRRDIERARLSSPSVRAKRSSPWDEWYDEMAIKTAILRLCKWLPQDAELAKALEAEEMQYEPTIRLEPEGPKSTADLSPHAPHPDEGSVNPGSYDTTTVPDQNFDPNDDVPDNL